MSTNAITAIPIRLELSTVSNPPVYPFDVNTGRTPRCWRAQSLAIAVGIFDENDVCVSIDNLDYLQFILKTGPNAEDPIVFSQTLANDAIIPSISRLSWENGANQQAIFELPKANTDQSLQGQQQADFWLVVQGQDTDGVDIIYGAGPLTIYNSGAPSVPPVSFVGNSYHAGTNSTGDVVIPIENGIHTEAIAISGSARTSVFSLPIVNRLAGDTCALNFRFAAPLIAGIVLDIRNASAVGTRLLTAADGFPDGTFTTDGYQLSARFVFVFTGTAWQYDGSKIPS